MILIGRGLDLAQVLKKRSIGRKERSVGESFHVQLSGCGKAAKSARLSKRCKQASDAKQRSDPKRQNAAIAVPNKFTISGGNDERVTPVPIPNTEVKPLSADGTWLDTARESRSLPDSTWEARKSFSFFRLLGVFVDNSAHLCYHSQ